MLVSLDDIVHLHLQNISTRQALRPLFTEIKSAEKIRIIYKPVETNKRVRFFGNFYIFDHNF